MKNISKLILILMLISMLFSACAPKGDAAEIAIPTPVPTAAPTPEPTPEPFDPEAAAVRLQEIVQENLTINTSAFEGMPENMFAEEGEWNIFGTTQEERAWLTVLPEAMEKQILDAVAPTAFQFIKEETEGVYSENNEWKLSYPERNWQLIYTLLKGADNAEQASEVITKSIVCQVELKQVGDRYVPNIIFDWLNYKDAIALLGGDKLRTISNGFAYSYCYTVYGPQAQELEYVQPEADGNFLTGITWPLASHTRLRKTWYADRDGGARKHTGTDIWAKADTEMYSCTDGTVTFIGYSDGMGNAVIVTDEYGYEFHYYHMIRLTDFLKEGDTVKAGDLIGHVGNTGNSSLDHLHLTIIAPDGFYVNPYPYLLEIEP